MSGPSRDGRGRETSVPAARVHISLASSRVPFVVLIFFNAAVVLSPQLCHFPRQCTHRAHMVSALRCTTSPPTCARAIERTTLRRLVSH